jgi:ABC-2 type transport system permease protein
MKAAWRRIFEILRKEFRQVLREPRMRGMLIGPPIIQLLIFGFAVNLDVENSKIGWMDLDQTPQSRELLAGFQGSRQFRVAAVASSEIELQELMDHGHVQLIVRVLPGFGRDILRARTAPVQILVDGTNSNTASIAANQAVAAVQAYSNKVMAGQMSQRLVGRTMAAGGPVNLEVPVLTFHSRVWFNPDLRSRNYYVPGVVVNIITLVTLMMTAMGIVREKEIGTMEQLMVTPIRPVELILGKTLPFALIGLLDVLLVTGVALLVFRIPLRGSVVLLLFASVLFLLTTLGTGLFISTICGTQQQAMMSSFFFFNPAFMLSGFTFPIRNMPEAVQYLTYLNPLRYFMEIVRGIFLKGSGITTLWPQMLALLIIGLAILGGSVLRFHKRLD